MGRKIGRLVNLGIAKEAVRGTAVAATLWVDKSELSFYDKVQKALSQGTYGVIGESNQELVALKWAEGEVAFDLSDTTFPLVLLATFGSLSSGSFNSVYKHTFTLQNDNIHDTLTFWVKDSVDTLIDRFSFVMIDKLTISAKPEELVTCKASFISRSSDTWAGTVTPAYTAVNKFLGRHVSVRLATLTGGLAAASRLNVKALELNISKNVMRDHALGTVQAIDLLNQKFEITGSFEIDLSDRTYQDLMNNGTYNAMRIDIVNSGVTIGTTNPSFRIDLSRCAFDAWEPARPNDTIATQKINFRAMYDVTNANIINDCYVVNATASY